MRTRPDHINFDPPRGTSISHFTEGMAGPVPSVTPEERQAVCDQIERHGLWGTDLPEMLGLVERQPDPAPTGPRLCPQSHDQDEHGGVRGDGRRYCLTCNRASSRAYYRRSA